MEPKRVVCIGDSVTEGFGLGEGELSTYPAVLSHLLGKDYIVYNQGVTCSCVLNICKDKTTMGLPYIKQNKYQQALNLKGDIYIIMLGTNDAQDGMHDSLPLRDETNNMISYHKEFTLHYQNIIDGIRKESPKSIIFVCKPVPIIECIWRKHQEDYLQVLLPYLDDIVKSNRQVYSIDVHQMFLEITGERIIAYYQKDGLHPNKAGANLIAHIIYDALINQGI